MAASTIEVIVDAGMAKPMFDALTVLLDAAAAVFIPITSPAAFDQRAA